MKPSFYLRRPNERKALFEQANGETRSMVPIYIAPKTYYPRDASGLGLCRRPPACPVPSIADSRPIRFLHTPCTFEIESPPRVQSFSVLQPHRTPHTRFVYVRYTVGKSASRVMSVVPINTSTFWHYGRLAASLVWIDRFDLRKES